MAYGLQHAQNQRILSDLSAKSEQISLLSHHFSLSYLSYLSLFSRSRLSLSVGFSSPVSLYFLSTILILPGFVVAPPGMGRVCPGEHGREM